MFRRARTRARVAVERAIGRAAESRLFPQTNVSAERQRPKTLQSALEISDALVRASCILLCLRLCLRIGQWRPESESHRRQSGAASYMRRPQIGRRQAQGPVDSCVRIPIFERSDARLLLLDQLFQLFHFLSQLRIFARRLTRSHLALAAVS